MRRRENFNSKREVAGKVDAADQQRWLDHAHGVRYAGNPVHKRNPGDFGLVPPASPRPNKSLCDDVQITSRKEALALLREGVERGLVSKRRVNGWPKNIWAFTEDGRPLEAQLENPENGSYHGYPLPTNDPFFDKLRERRP